MVYLWLLALFVTVNSTEIVKGLFDGPCRHDNRVQQQRCGSYASFVRVRTKDGGAKVFEIDLSHLFKYHPKLSTIIEQVERDPTFELKGKPGGMIKSKEKMRDLTRRARGKEQRTLAQDLWKPHKTDEFYCICLAKPYSFIAFMNLVNFGRFKHERRKFNYILTHLAPIRDVRGRRDESARWVWRFMHTGGKMKDIKAKHWLLNEEDRGDRILLAGEMILYGAANLLKNQPYSLVMDSCSGTFKPTVTDEVIKILQNMFALNRIRTREWMYEFQYHLLTPLFATDPRDRELSPPRLLNKYLSHPNLWNQLMIIGEVRGHPEERKSDVLGHRNCVSEWIKENKIDILT